jgi:4,5-DOPA dioxygenase extradiol
MDRRNALRVLFAAGVAGPLASACRVRGERDDVQAKNEPAAAMPAIFLAHGSPMLLDDAAWVAQLADWGRALPRPKAILVLSAHWEARPATLGATRTVPLVYDFYNFPARYYQVTYAAPGAPDLAARVKALLSPKQPVAEDPQRGLDHGAYVPLVAMYPQADVPVLQLSLPSLEPAALFELGRALAPLRREGVLIMGSGFLTHNLRRMDFNPDAPPPAWASEFDAWCGDVLARRDVDALLDYRNRAPGVQIALPTHEHFAPVVATLGAGTDDGSPVRFPITGFTYGSATKRSVQVG